MSEPKSYVIWDSKRLIPAPQMSIARTHKRSGDSSIIGSDMTITLTGKLVACKGWDFSGDTPTLYTGSGYPSDDDGCCKFQNILDMQQALREFFAVTEDYKWFEIQSLEQDPPSPAKKWRCRVSDISFGEGQWVNQCEYSITLDVQSESTVDNYTDFDESWNVNFDEASGGVYQLEHTLSVSAKEFYDSDEDAIIDGWKKAKAWLDNRLAGSEYNSDGIKSSIIYDSTGFNLGDSWDAYNYTIRRTADEYGGVYSINETWTLSENPYHHEYTVSYESSAGESFDNITISGSFTGFRTSPPDDTEGGFAAAKSAYESWDDADSPYSIANSHYGGCGSLNSCATRKSVTYDKEARRVSYEYSFNDSDDTGAQTTLSTTIDYNYQDGCTTSITISGSIVGRTCDCETTAFANAQAAFDSLDIATKANEAYTGSGTLYLIASNETKDETSGNIAFSYSYSDLANTVDTQTVTISYSRDSKGEDGNPITNVTVQGTKGGVCGTSDWDTVKSSVPSEATAYSVANSYYNGGQSLNSCASNKSYTYNEDTLNIQYSYEFTDGDDVATVDATVTISTDPSDCDAKKVSISGNITGIHCGGKTAWENAKAQWASYRSGIKTITNDIASASGITFSTLSLANRNVTLNDYQGTITFNYEYSDASGIKIDITRTESTGQDNCGIVKYGVEGTITATCEAGGYSAALTEYNNNHQVSDYKGSYNFISSSITKNESGNQVRFSYQFDDRSTNYIHNQTITVRTDEKQSYDTIVVNGTITGICNSNEGSKYSNAVSAWNTIQTSLESDVNGVYSCSDSLRLARTSVGRNEYGGTITYNYEYRCGDSFCFTGAIAESIDISKELQADVFAVVPILGRANGPIVQDKGTKTLEKCSISIQVTFAPNNSCVKDEPDAASEVEDMINNHLCCDGTSYIESNRKTWNPKTGRYTRSVTWVCPKC